MKRPIKCYFCKYRKTCEEERQLARMDMEEHDREVKRNFITKILNESYNYDSLLNIIDKELND